MRNLIKAGIAGVIVSLSHAGPVAADPVLVDRLASSAYVLGDYAAAMRIWRGLADQGNAGAQFNLGLLYQDGHGVPQDFVSAYMWFTLANKGGNTDAIRNRGFVAAKMTREQIAEAEKRFAAWHPSIASSGEGVPRREGDSGVPNVVSFGPPSGVPNAVSFGPPPPWFSSRTSGNSALTESTASPESSEKISRVPTAPNVVTKPPIEFPSTSVAKEGHRRNAIAQLKIETEAGANYVIKLINVTDAKDQTMIYIRGGVPFSTKVPLGSYHIRAASGITWYGKDDLFGPDTRFIKLSKLGAISDDDRAFKFFKQGNTIMGHRIIFRKEINGTMTEEKILLANERGLFPGRYTAAAA